MFIDLVLSFAIPSYMRSRNTNFVFSDDFRLI